MKIRVLVKLKTKTGKIEKMGENNFKIWVKEAPVEGRANQAIVKMVADYFGITPSRVAIISGRTAKNKIIEIL